MMLRYLLIQFALVIGLAGVACAPSLHRAGLPLKHMSAGVLPTSKAETMPITPSLWVKLRMGWRYWAGWNINRRAPRT